MEQKIDERLQKAAEEYIEHTPRYDIGYELENGNDPTEIDCFTIDDAITAFKAGAQWQRDSIWHNNEEPPLRSYILLDNGSIFVVNQWSAKIAKEHKWCYLSDILPSETTKD